MDGASGCGHGVAGSGDPPRISSPTSPRTPGFRHPHLPRRPQGRPPAAATATGKTSSGCVVTTRRIHIRSGQNHWVPHPRLHVLAPSAEPSSAMTSLFCRWLATFPCKGGGRASTGAWTGRAGGDAQTLRTC